MSEHTKTLRFVRRATPVFPEHRPLYKIAQILLLLDLSSRGGKSSLPRLQLINWALKTTERKARLAASVKKGELNVAAWGFDPVVPLALRFAEADKLVEQTTTGYQITDLGKKFVKGIKEDADSLESERIFYMTIGKALTEGMVTAVTNKWGEA